MALPLSGTDIRLLSGIPFTSDYKHTRYFKNRVEREAWFLSRPYNHRMQQANVVKIEGKSYIQVDKHIDQLWNVNYLMFKNTQYKEGYFYGFVSKLEFLNPKSTRVYFDLDVYHTFIDSVDFRPSYVVREHMEDGSHTNPAIHTLDEGLDYGLEYETKAVSRFAPYDDIFFLVIVSKARMHYDADGKAPDGKPQAVLNGSPQPLSYYIHPFRKDGSSPDVKIGDKDIPLSSILTFLSTIYSQDDAVNNIVSLYVTEHPGTRPDYDAVNDVITFSASAFEEGKISDDNNTNLSTVAVKRLANYYPIEYSFGQKYARYEGVKNNKLFMYPYTVIELTDFKGQSITLHPEYIDGDTLKITAIGSLGTSNKVAYVPNYGTSEVSSDDDKLMVGMQYALIQNQPNDIEIINDYLSSYLQGNRNSIQAQESAIRWDTVFGALNGFMGAGSASDAGSRVGIAQGGISATQSVVSGSLQMAQLDAKKADIANIPPSLQKMGSNTHFSFGNNITGLYVLFKQVKPEYRDKLDDYFSMYGYKCNRVKRPNFNTRKIFNYVETRGATIRSLSANVAVPTDILLQLTQIFDSGITLWHTDVVGDYTSDNVEV